MKNGLKKFLLALTLIAGISGYFVYDSLKRPSKKDIPKSSPQILPGSQTTAGKHVYPETIVGKIVTLKKLSLDHAFDFYQAFSPTVRKSLEFPETISYGYIYSVIDERVEEQNKGLLISYTIWEKDTLIGEVKIVDKKHDDTFDYGQLAMWLNEKYWGGGRIQEALKLISREYFLDHPSEKTYNAHVREWNTRSQKSMEKFGFKRIGNHFKDGKLFAIVYELNSDVVFQ